jgi:hypothetical protein
MGQAVCTPRAVRGKAEMARFIENFNDVPPVCSRGPRPSSPHLMEGARNTVAATCTGAVPRGQERTDTPRASSPAPVPHLEMTFTACVKGTSTGCTRSRGRMNSEPAAGVGTEGTSTV